MQLEGRTALVTGGGRGIGRAVAERLAREGARVVVAARTDSEIEEVARATGGIAVRMDVASRVSIEAALAAARQRAGRIDILVANAGVGASAPFDRTDDALWDRVLATNATSVFLLCRALIPAMIEAGWGRVVAIASNAGLTGYTYASAYCASKHAVIGLVRSIALEIARTPVTINAVCPGWVATRMADEAVERIADKTGRSSSQARRALEEASPQRRMMEPAEVAHVVAALCAHDARGIHGQTLSVDGGQVMR
jgi:NAD(P)-dependent dehydrogenase (short-subunit alcohol dehydrogenase family)